MDHSGEDFDCKVKEWQRVAEDKLNVEQVFICSLKMHRTFCSGSIVVYNIEIFIVSKLLPGLS